MNGTWPESRYMSSSECLVCWLAILAAAGSRVCFNIADNPFFSRFSLCVCCFRCPSFSVLLVQAFNQAVGEWDVARVTDMRYSECLVCWPILASAGSRVFFIYS